MCCGDKQFWRELAASGRTPYDMVNADGENFIKLNTTHVASLHREAMEGLQRGILNSGEQNFWAVITGEYGSGKTHLLQKLQEWACHHRVFFMWVGGYYGRDFLNVYLVRNLLDALITTPAFNNDLAQGNMLQQLVLPLLNRVVDRVAGVGETDWPQKLCLDQGIWQRIFFNPETYKKHIKECLRSCADLPKLSSILNIDKLIKLVVQQYRGELEPRAAEPFNQLMHLALIAGDDENARQQAFINLLREQDRVEADSEDETEKKQHGEEVEHRRRLLAALLFIISRSDIPVCLALDRFEAMYTRLMQVYLDKQSEEERNAGKQRMKTLLNDIFGAFEKFFNDGRNIALVFTAQHNQWRELDRSDLLEGHIRRRIQEIYHLLTPSEEEILTLIAKRLGWFGEQIGRSDFSDIYPLDREKMIKIIRSRQRRLSEILPDLRRDFTATVAKLGGEDEITSRRQRLLCLSGQLRDFVQRQRNALESMAESDNDHEWTGGYLGETSALLHEFLSYIGETRRRLLGQPEAPEIGELAALRQKLDELEEQRKASIAEVNRQNEGIVRLTTEKANLVCRTVQFARGNQLLKEELEHLKKTASGQVEYTDTPGKENGESIQALADSKGEIERLGQRLADSDNEVERLRNSLTDSKNEIERLIAENHNTKQSLQQIQQKADRLENEVERLQFQSSRFSEENERLSGYLRSACQSNRNNTKRRERWYRLVRGHGVNVVAVRDCLCSYGIEDADNLKLLQAKDRLIDELDDEGLKDFLKECYSLYDLRALATKYNLTTTGSKDALIERILES